jgi:hypothetical protein
VAQKKEEDEVTTGTYASRVRHPIEAIGIPLYGGEVLLSFDPSLHRYEVKDHGRIFEVPSVTTILSVVDKSGPLTQWAANCVIDHLRGKIVPGQAYDEIALEMIFQDARFNFRRVSGEAKAIGALVHDWTERWLKAEAAHFVFVDLELWNGMTVQVRLRLCEQHARKVEQDYLRGRVSDWGLSATAGVTLAR